MFAHSLHDPLLAFSSAPSLFLSPPTPYAQVQTFRITTDSWTWMLSLMPLPFLWGAFHPIICGPYLIHPSKHNLVATCSRSPFFGTLQTWLWDTISLVWSALYLSWHTSYTCTEISLPWVTDSLKVNAAALSILRCLSQSLQYAKVWWVLTQNFYLILLTTLGS